MRNCQLPNPNIHFHLFFNNRIIIQPCAQLKYDMSPFLLQIHVVYDQLLVNNIYAKKILLRTGHAHLLAFLLPTT